MESEELDIGYVAGPHGVQGGVRIKLHDPASQALQRGIVLTFVRDGARTEHEVEAADVVPGKSGLHRVRLSGVNRRELAEALKGSTIVVPRAVLPKLADDEFYLADVVGLAVMRDAQPQHLGKIVGLTSNGVQDLFEVEWTSPDDHRHLWMMPVLPGLVRDVDDTRVLVELPAGFLPDGLELPS